MDLNCKSKHSIQIFIHFSYSQVPDADYVTVEIENELLTKAKCSNEIEQATVLHAKK